MNMRCTLKQKRTKGFTLIELLVVIAIIGILSGVIYASLDHARSIARDKKRVADLSALQIALKLYYSEYHTYDVSGAGYHNGGNGWISLENGTDYPTSITRALYNDGLLDQPNVEDPIQNPGFMLYTCDGGNSYSLSATLENPTPEDIAYIQTTCNGVGSNGTYTHYGKNYAVSSD